MTATQEGTKDRAPGGAIEAAEAQRTRFVDALESVRKRADVAAKVFGAVATTAVTAVGLSEIGDLFPVPAGPGWVAVVVAVVSFGMLAVSVLLFTRRLWRASAPIYTVSSLTAMATELDGRGGREYGLIKKVYDEAVHTRSRAEVLAKGCSLKDYEREGVRLQREADAEGALTGAGTKQEQAAVIRAEVAAAQARATALVARDRAARAVSGRATGGIVVLFLVALVVFGGATDWLAAQRDDARIALAKSCGDAQKAIDDGGGVGGAALPAACGPPNGGSASAPTAPQPAQEQSITVAALGEQWRDCVAKAEQPAELAVCDATRRLILQVVGTAP